MSNNLVKESQLREVLSYSWEKTKAKNIARGELSITSSERQLKLIDGNSQSVNINISDLAALSQSNEFTKANSFEDVLLNDGLKESTDISNKVIDVFGTYRIYIANRGLTTRVFSDNYISTVRVHLRDEVANNIPNGIQNVQLWAVTKKDSRENDVVNKRVDNRTSLPLQNINGTKYIEFIVNEKFEEETYFLLAVTSDGGANSNGRRFKAVNLTEQSDIDNVINSTTAPSPGQTPTHTSGSFYPLMDLIGRASIKNMIQKSGDVKTVNGGSANNNGDIGVSVGGGNTNITMSFGTGGTPVTIVTYLTNEELSSIKSIFDN